MIELKITGSAEDVRAQLRALLGGTPEYIGVISGSMTNSMRLRPASEGFTLSEEVAFVDPRPPLTPEQRDTVQAEEPAPKKRGRPAKAKAEEPEPSIRANPENREPPADEQDDAATQAQDAADEAAELEPVPENDVTSMFDEPGDTVDVEPDVTVNDVRTTLGDWLTRAGHLKGEKHPLEAYKVVFADVTDGVYTTLKDLTEKNAPPAVLASLVAAIKKQDVK